MKRRYRKAYHLRADRLKESLTDWCAQRLLASHLEKHDSALYMRAPCCHIGPPRGDHLSVLAIVFVLDYSDLTSNRPNKSTEANVESFFCTAGSRSALLTCRRAME